MDQLELGRAEWSGLGQKLRRNPHLANIVQVTRDAQPLQALRVEPELGTDGNRDFGHPALVSGGVGIAHFAQGRNHLHRAHERDLDLRQVTLDLLFCPLLVSDVRADAAIAGERAGGIEHRIAADREKAHAAVAVQP